MPIIEEVDSGIDATSASNSREDSPTTKKNEMANMIEDDPLQLKFLPLSENSFAHLPLRAMNLFNAAMNAWDVKSDTNSICTALKTKHTKIQIYTLNKFPLRCPLFLMRKGPEKSTLEQSNG
ncbi:hypothetical protein TNCV_363991 [Trichonephila clavipes]|uniref:Uncharacterized protein n=1 Tax=Trichonephila clavipes TaxID=2585209 RepID=A0A8X6SQ27_TRICX|nr:hypothetical protein TNCV_363991 [Trichonephila clavipes]